MRYTLIRITRNVIEDRDHAHPRIAGRTMTDIDVAALIKRETGMNLRPEFVERALKQGRKVARSGTDERGDYNEYWVELE